MDVDLVARIASEHLKPLLKLLGDDYQANESALREAIQRKSWFKLTHYPESFKVDAFIRPRSAV